MQNDLLKLREEVLQAAQPLLDAQEVSDEDRLKLTLRLATVKQDPGLYRKAFDLIGRLENNDQRLEQYLELLDEVEFALNERLDDEKLNGPTEDAEQHQ